MGLTGGFQGDEGQSRDLDPLLKTPPGREMEFRSSFERTVGSFSRLAPADVFIPFLSQTQLAARKDSLGDRWGLSYS